LFLIRIKKNQGQKNEIIWFGRKRTEGSYLNRIEKQFKLEGGKF